MAVADRGESGARIGEAGRGDVETGGRGWPNGSARPVGQREADRQSSNASGSDWSNTNSGMGSASVGSKAEV